MLTADTVPHEPDAPGVPFPPVAEDAFDPELTALAARLRPAHRWVQGSRVACIVVAAWLAFALRHDLRFAFASSSVVELGEVAHADLGSHLHERVGLSGVPSGIGAIEYRRPLGHGWYRLAPMVNREDLYVELHLPEGADPSRWMPPTTWVGRLVPMDEAGIRFLHVRKLVEQATGHPMTAHAYLLEPGPVPSFRSSSVWLALVALLVGVVQAAFLALDLRASSSTSTSGSGPGR